MGATWNIRTRQLWYIFDVDVVTVLEETNNIHWQLASAT
uniref:Uncharacterized protein n=1 Tax=Setaria italica TaxID=4555 RepID=K4AI21_SETIT